MKLYNYLNILLLLIYGCTSSHSQFNFDFEQIDPGTNNFKGLTIWGTGYDIMPDSAVKHSGRYSMCISRSLTAKDAQFGCGVLTIPAKYEGKQIELRGYLKYENVSNGNVGLFIRIDGRSSANRMDNMLNRGLAGSSDWKQFSLRLPLSNEDHVIYLGAILSGQGRLWVDDLQVLIDGSDLSKAKQKKDQVFKALLDTAFNRGSNIKLSSLKRSDYENLALLGQIWGLLKYYHPEIAKGNYNWDYELFRELPKILQCNNKQSRNQTLLDWIESFGGKLEPDTIEIADINDIKMMPDLQWAQDESNLGEDLVKKLKQVIAARRVNKHYYFDFNYGVLNPIFQNEASYSDFSYPDDGFRLLALYRYWNIIQYFYPYKNLIKDDWKRALLEFIPEFLNAKNALDYRIAVLKLIVKIKDTHANIYSYDLYLENYWGKNRAACMASFVADKLVVTRVLSDVDPHNPLLKGDVIMKIGEKDVNTIVKERLPISSASNYPSQLRTIALNIFRTNEDSLSVMFLRNGVRRNIRMNCRLSAFDQPQQKKSWEIIKQNIGYINAGALRNTELPEMMKNFMPCAGIIVDLRSYPFDFFIFALSEYLLPKPAQFVKFSNTSYKMPGMFSFSASLTVGKLNADYYKGKIVIIVDEGTASSGEYHTMAFQKAPKATVIGSTTAGADGNVSQFYLPGGILTKISGIGVYYPDGTETQGVGIVPDIYIRPTVNGIMNGKDELLEKAIEIIQKQN